MIKYNEKDLIKKIEQEFRPELKLKYSMEEVLVDDIIPSTLYLDKNRYEFALNLMSVYKNEDPFKPIITNINGVKHLICPPIIEKRPEGLILCDGMHRVFACKQLNIKSIYVLVVKNSPLCLAGDLVSWNQVKIVNYKVPLKDKFLNFNPEGFTGYSKYFNSISKVR